MASSGPAAILAIVVRYFFGYGNGFRKELSVAGIDGSRRPPDSGQIGFAVHGAGRGAGRGRVALQVRRDGQRIFAKGAQLGAFFEPDVERDRLSRPQQRRLYAVAFEAWYW